MGRTNLREIAKLTVKNKEAAEEKAVEKINEAKLTTVTESVGETTEPKTEPPAQTPPDIGAIVAAAVADAVKGIASQNADGLQKIKEEYDSRLTTVEQSYSERVNTLSQQLQETQRQLQEAKDAETRLAETYKITGSQMPLTKTPALNTVTTTDSDRPVGVLQEAMSLVDTSLTIKKNNLGSIYEAYDYSAFDRFVAENKAQVIKDLESWGRKNGLLRGNELGVVGAAKEAATTSTDIVGGFLRTLSSLMRMTHVSGKIFWQFPTTQIDFTKGNGLQIEIPRAAFLPTSTTASDWLLSGAGAFAEISTGDNPITTGTVVATLNEYGMGKAGTTMPPVKIPTFVAAYSMINLLDILNRNLGMNYAEFEDLMIRNLWKATSRVVYNDADSITTTPGNVGAGDKGTMTGNFLAELYSYMHTLRIPLFPDGCYGIAMPPRPVVQLKKDLETRWQAHTERDLVELTNILNPSIIPPGDTGKVTGYVGKYYGFHIFETNAIGVGNAGSEMVQNVTLGGGSVLTRSSLAFGSNTIGRGIGDPMEIRESELTNYGRKKDYIWTSSEAFIAMDVDPTGYSDSSAVPQQLRVIEVRTTDVAQ